MTDTILSLSDVPDFSAMAGLESDFVPFQNGWYRAEILGSRSFTDRNGNDRVFESSDAPSKDGSSRNIRLETTVTRKDGRTLNSTIRVNYRPEDLTQEVMQAIAAQAEKNKADGGKPTWGEHFRAYMALTQLSQLQRVAGVRQFQRDTNIGGLDISPLFGKTVYVRLADDKRNPLYKEIDKFMAQEPKKTPLL